jgi:mRNA interferase HicA
MKGSEFLKRIRKPAKHRGLAFEWHPNLGKGSHGVLKLGDWRTVLRNPKDELKTGTLHAMLKQLGLREEALLSHLSQRDSPIPGPYSIQWFHHKTLNRNEESGYGVPSYCTSSASPIGAAT